MKKRSVVFIVLVIVLILSNLSTMGMANSDYQYKIDVDFKNFTLKFIDADEVVLSEGKVAVAKPASQYLLPVTGVVTAVI